MVDHIMLLLILFCFNKKVKTVYYFDYSFEMLGHILFFFFYDFNLSFNRTFENIIKILIQHVN